MVQLAADQTLLGYIKCRIDDPAGQDSSDGLSLEDALTDPVISSAAFSHTGREAALRYAYDQFVGVYETFDKLPISATEGFVGQIRARMEGWECGVEKGLRERVDAGEMEGDQWSGKQVLELVQHRERLETKIKNMTGGGLVAETD